MSHLLFLDESGTDQKQMPYEVHGGVVIPMYHAWDVIRSIRDAEARLFGSPLTRFGLEVKGERLLQRRVFQFAEGRNKKNPEIPPPDFVDDEDRRKNAFSFLEKGSARQTPTARKFRAYGLSCLELVDDIFQICEKNRVSILAAVVDLGAPVAACCRVVGNAPQRLCVLI